jgi:phosphotransacetylase
LIKTYLLHNLILLSKTKHNNIGLTEGTESRILHACYLFIKENLGKITLLGNVELIKKNNYNKIINKQK